MNCQELLDLLLDYIGGELVVEKHRTFEIHLSGCNKCVMLVGNLSTHNSVCPRPYLDANASFERRGTAQENVGTASGSDEG